MIKLSEILKQLLLQMLQQQATALLRGKNGNRNLSKETQVVKSQMVILELKTTVTEI